ncbi:ATP-binding cassette domain-containing protein [Salipaludibacillus sp. LMS25]|uniref:ABC transporter ATP-binding protein n=1 Tax=Salipaludibacillus sp. LMS25 TaxID=2924031 RepID=UPI0020D0B233|nr:ATP-binding cassette domain-containing protein [Salipaludibacillus sp. LMS25]UTR14442.1 ATP-binding cassette domain-containing protein [Salipaludibacillus sp. LMS25]
MMTDITPLVEADNVHSSRLKKINFKMYEGDILTVIGPSGAGKSSLLMLLNRLEQHVGGALYFKGKNVTEHDVSKLRKSIGMVFQSSSLFDGTVEDNLKYGPMLFGEWFSYQGEKLLEEVQLSPDFLNKNVNQLSGGEQQRVALARTLANNPDVLLLDEVTSALDLVNVGLIEEFLQKIVPARIKAIMMVTHDIKQAERIGTKLLFMDNKTIEAQGPIPDIFQNPANNYLSTFLSKG